MAQSLLQVRQARERSFPSELFDEHAWNILLHLFVALANNETVSEKELISRARSRPSVGAG